MFGFIWPSLSGQKWGCNDTRVSQKQLLCKLFLYGNRVFVSQMYFDLIHKNEYYLTHLQKTSKLTFLARKEKQPTEVMYLTL